MRTQSKKPKKQRQFQFDPPRHEVHKLLSANLSPSLRETKGFRSLPLRKGDTVTITRGDMKGKSGKVSRIDLKKQRVFLDKIVKRKTDNTEIPFPLHPSNLVITKYVEKGDRKRLELINRRIKKEESKIDIEAVMAEVEEDEEVIELEDEDLLVPLDDEDDVELLDDEEDILAEDDEIESKDPKDMEDES